MGFSMLYIKCEPQINVFSNKPKFVRIFLAIAHLFLALNSSVACTNPFFYEGDMFFDAHEGSEAQYFFDAPRVRLAIDFYPWRDRTLINLRESRDGFMFTERERNNASQITQLDTNPNAVITYSVGNAFMNTLDQVMQTYPKLDEIRINAHGSPGSEVISLRSNSSIQTGLLAGHQDYRSYARSVATILDRNVDFNTFSGEINCLVCSSGTENGFSQGLSRYLAEDYGHRGILVRGYNGILLALEGSTLDEYSRVHVSGTSLGVINWYESLNNNRAMRVITEGTPYLGIFPRMNFFPADFSSTSYIDGFQQPDATNYNHLVRQHSGPIIREQGYLF